MPTCGRDLAVIVRSISTAAAWRKRPPDQAVRDNPAFFPTKKPRVA